MSAAERIARSMIGRRVESKWHCVKGVVVAWRPLEAGGCDLRVREDDGHEVAVPSGDVKPIDGLGGLPSRTCIQDLAERDMQRTLHAIREKLGVEFRKPWAGCEFGKALVGRMFDDALKGGNA